MRGRLNTICRGFFVITARSAFRRTDCGLLTSIAMRESNVIVPVFET
jgi:hypothetical protein